MGTATITINKRRAKMNGLDVVYGSLVNDSSAGGDIATGLTTVETFMIIPAASTSTIPYVNETFPLSGGEVSVVTASDSLTYYWIAMGTV